MDKKAISIDELPIGSSFATKQYFWYGEVLTNYYVLVHTADNQTICLSCDTEQVKIISSSTLITNYQIKK